MNYWGEFLGLPRVLIVYDRANSLTGRIHVEHRWLYSYNFVAFPKWYGFTKKKTRFMVSGTHKEDA